MAEGHGRTDGGVRVTDLKTSPDGKNAARHRAKTRVGSTRQSKHTLVKDRGMRARYNIRASTRARKHGERSVVAHGKFCPAHRFLGSLQQEKGLEPSASGLGYTSARGTLTTGAGTLDGRKRVGHRPLCGERPAPRRQYACVSGHARGTFCFVESLVDVCTFGLGSIRPVSFRSATFRFVSFPCVGRDCDG